MYPRHLGVLSHATSSGLIKDKGHTCYQNVRLLLRACPCAWQKECFTSQATTRHLSALMLTISDTHHTRTNLLPQGS